MTEKFANTYQTTLSAAITGTGDLTLSVTSATGAPLANFRIKIDSEYMLVTDVSGTTFTVQRGMEGSTAATHSSGATVTHVLTAGGLVQALAEVNTPTKGDLLAIVNYAPGSDSQIVTTTSTPLIDADATNLKITFTAPVSGAVLIKLSGLVDSGGRNYWGIREGSTTLRSAWVMSSGSSGSMRGHAEFYINGLTPGTSYTYKWGIGTNGTGTANLYAGPTSGTYGQAVMEVYDAAAGVGITPALVIGQMSRAAYDPGAGYTFQKITVNTSVTALNITCDTTNNRITALIAGWYYVRAHARIVAASSNAIGVTIYKNGSEVGGTAGVTGDPTYYPAAHGEGLVYLAVGDYVEMWAGYQFTGGIDQIYFEAFMISSALVSPAGCSIYHSTTEASPSVLAFNSELYDTNGFHDTSTNNSRITIPAGLGGKYLFTFGSNSSSSSQPACRLKKNGATIIGPNWYPTTTNTSITGSVVVDLADGDYVQVEISGAATLGHASAFEAQSQLTATRIGITPLAPSGMVTIAPTSDTYLNDGAATTNYDTAADLIIGADIGSATGFTRVALMTFDLSSLARRTIALARLRMTVSNRNDPIGGVLLARKILRAYNATQVTWNIYSTGNNWSTAGARSIGNDADSVYHGSVSPSPSGLYPWAFYLDITSLIQDEIAAGTATLRIAIGGAGTNGNSLAIGSLENATVAYRPKLEVLAT